MTQALQIANSVANIAQQLDYSVDFVQTVKDTIAKGATDLELKLFLQTAKRTGLDPFARQIYAIKRWDSSLKKETLTAQVSIDGFRLIADRTNSYVPGKDSTFTFDEQNNLESATAYIKNFVGGVWHEISATAFYDEYVQKTREGKPNSMWQKMPRLMLNKCAESLVLRKAFPAELSGLYTPEEMGNPESVEVKSEKPSAQIEVQNQIALNPLYGEIAEICKELNAENDLVKWTPGALTSHIRELFDREDWDLHALTNDDLEILIGDLNGRLDEIRERNAVMSESSEEIVDGEIFENKV